MSEDNIDDTQDLSENEAEETQDEGQEVSEDERLSNLSDKEEAEEKSEKEKTQEAKEEIKRLADEDLEKVITLKVNGEEKTMKVKDAIKLTQLEQASRAKMQEAAQIKKQFEQVVRLAQQDPKQFFQLLGVDPYEFAESTLAEKLELLEMSDEQRKLLEYEEKLKKYEETEKEMKEREAREREEAEVYQAQVELDKEIGEAWKNSGLPMRKEFVTAIAQEMYGASLAKENLTATEAANRVRDNWVRSVQETIKNMDAEAIQNILGTEGIEKIRDFDIKRVTQKQRATQTFKSPGATSASSSNKRSQALSEKEYEDWKESLRRSLS